MKFRTQKITALMVAAIVGVLNDSFYCPGYKLVEDRRIHCANRRGHGAQNFVKGAENSCNPVFIEVGLRLGADKYYQYFRQFGLMEKTGIDLPGEAGCPLLPSGLSWTDVEPGRTAVWIRRGEKAV